MSGKISIIYVVLHKIANAQSPVNFFIVMIIRAIVLSMPSFNDWKNHICIAGSCFS